MNKLAKIVTSSTLAIMTILNPIILQLPTTIAYASEHSTKKNTKIKIDTKKNKIYLYKKIDGEWKLVKTEKCSTGKNGATPKGKFKTKSKESSFTKEGKEYKYVTYFKDNYAIHSTGHDEEGYHNSCLGHSRSHGCVRVKPKTAKWIYKNVKHGTEVEVE